MPLENFYKKINALQKFDIKNEVILILNENADTIISLIRGQMGSKGTTGDGKFIKAKYGNTYRDSTVFNKERHGVGLGKKTDFVTMFMSGAFYASLELGTSGTTFSVYSDLEYFDELNSWNNGKLLELDKQNLEYFRNEYLIPQLKQRAKAYGL